MGPGRRRSGRSGRGVAVYEDRPTPILADEDPGGHKPPSTLLRTLQDGYGTLSATGSGPARLARRVAARGPVPWIVAAALVLVAWLVVDAMRPGDDARPLEASSREELLARLAANETAFFLDSDHDGLLDAHENYVYGTNATDWDSNDDGIPDGWAADYGFDPLDPRLSQTRAAAPPPGSLPPGYDGEWPDAFTPRLLDLYRYGRPADWSEAERGVFRNGIDPRDWDANDDGIPDGWLLFHGLNLTQPLGDDRLAGDGGLTVRQAFQNQTDPRRLDTDADGLHDLEEIQGRTAQGTEFRPTDPRRYSSSLTGVCDGYLVHHGLDPNDPTSSRGDPDNDGATTQEEFNHTKSVVQDPCSGRAGLDPLSNSTGGNGLPDGWLLRYGLDPLDSGIAGRATDSAAAASGDVPLPALSLTVRDEYQLFRPRDWKEATQGPWWGGSDPSRNDTDGDGLGDAEELRGWSLSVATSPGQNVSEPQRVTSDPTKRDADEDGLVDAEERRLGTHPQRRDTDFDGLADARESILKLDPLLADTAGDGLRDGERYRLLEERQARVTAGESYEFPGGPGAPRSYLDVAKRMPGGAEFSASTDLATLARFFGPEGNLDGDNKTNLLDPDADGDQLLNGWEARPELYRSSPHGEFVGAQPRPASDPFHVDTDDDGLLDGWEVRFARADYAAGSPNPDPSRFDTDDDGLSDALEDDDEDSIRWYDFRDGRRVERRYNHTNLEEQKHETDPNDPQADDDGLLDGWKVFWGVLYEGATGEIAPPGAPRPTLGTRQDDVTITTLATRRFATASEPRAPWEAVTSTYSIPDPDDLSTDRIVFRVEGTYRFRFLEAQEAGTNPYALDTDHDQMADVWEYYESKVRIRGDDCVGETVSPLLADDALDPDGDGLSNRLERQFGTDPACQDTDLGGLRDGHEVDFTGLFPDDPEDDQSILNSDLDTDGDGLTDYRELTSTPRTDARRPDTDGDGLLDGPTWPPESNGWNQDDARVTRLKELGVAYLRVSRSDGTTGYRFLGEASFGTSPIALSQRGDNVPDGWVIAQGGQPNSIGGDWSTCYRYGRPAWWAEPLHGPWWGGGRPLVEACARLADVRDADADGLDDLAGEDPFPVANRDNAFPAGDPFEAGAAPDEARRRAQASIVPLVYGPSNPMRGPPTGAPPERSDVQVVDANVPAEPLVRGRSYAVTGRVVALNGTPAPDITIVARIGDAMVGAAFTGPDGAFTLSLVLASNHSVALDAPQRVLLGVTSGDANWTLDPATIPLGDTILSLDTYPSLVRPDGAYARAHAELPVRVLEQPEPQLTLTEPVTAGAKLAVRVLVVDEAGVPMSARLRLGWLGQEVSFTTGGNGLLVTDLSTGAGDAGRQTLTVEVLDDLPHRLSASIERDVRIQRRADISLESLPPRIDAGDVLQVRGRLDTEEAGAKPIQIRLQGPRGSPTTATATTDARGAFEARITVDRFGAGGVYVVRAAFEGSDDTAADATTRNTQVRARPVFETEGAPWLETTGEHTLRFRLRGPLNEPLAGRSVTVRLGSAETTTTTGPDGAAQATLTVSLPPGFTESELSYAGDDTYAPASVLRQLPTRSDAILVVPDGHVRAGTEVRVPIRLQDPIGRPVAGRPLLARWGAEAAVPLLTDLDGAAFLVHSVPIDAPLGAVPVTVSFGGDERGPFRATTTNAAWDIRSPVAFDFPDRDLLQGAPGPAAYLRLPEGEPVASARIEVQTPGAPPRVLVTDASGRIDPLDGANLTQHLGTHQVLLRFLGNERWEPLQHAARLRVRAATTLDVASDLVVVRGEPHPVLVHLDSRIPFAEEDGTVKAVVDGRDAGESGLDGNRSLVEVLTDRPLGNATLRLEFSGTDLHAAAATETPARIVGRAQVEVVQEPTSGGRLRLRVLVDNEALPFAQITIRTPQAPHGLHLRADESGLIELTLPRPDEETVLVASFEGAETATTASVAMVLDGEAESASPLGTWIWFLPVALALAAIAAWIVWRQRRHPLLAAVRRAERALTARGPYEAEILLCYANFEDALIETGLLAGRAPTPRLLGDMLAQSVDLGLAREPLNRLLTLFEAARYGRVEMGPSQRDATRAALRELRRSILLDVDIPRTRPGGTPA